VSGDGLRRVRVEVNSGQRQRLRRGDEPVDTLAGYEQDLEVRHKPSIGDDRRHDRRTIPAPPEPLPHGADLAKQNPAHQAPQRSEAHKAMDAEIDRMGRAQAKKVYRHR